MFSICPYPLPLFTFHPSLPGGGLSVWIPLTGLPFPGFHLSLANGEMGKKEERDISVFILLAKLHVRSPVLMEHCCSLNDGLLYMSLASCWFQDGFPPIMSSISVG